MKKIILIIFILAGTLKMQAQCELPYEETSQLPYKSFSEFANDTTSFIIYNFFNRSKQYSYYRKKLKDVVNDLQFPIKNISPVFYSANGNDSLFVTGITIHIYDSLYQAKREEMELELNAIYITFRADILEYNYESPEALLNRFKEEPIFRVMPVVENIDCIHTNILKSMRPENHSSSGTIKHKDYSFTIIRANCVNTMSNEYVK